MNPKKALRKFMLHVGTAPVGSRFETGITWHARSGWRVYQRAADAGLMMTAADARGLAAAFDKLASAPEWRGTATAAEMAGHFQILRTLADEADQKNRDKIVPPDMPVVSPFGGTA